ncbi:NADP-dependent oxidoreductase domain-containing protein [Schizophyllum commune]
MVKYLGKDVGPIGFGLMSLTFNANHSVEHSIACMKTALEAGANVWNGGEFYGSPEHNSLHIVKAYFEKYPEDADRVILSIKGAVAGVSTGQPTPDNSPEGIRRSVDFCLGILQGVKKIDVFEPGRRDASVPVETMIKALKELVDEGKIGAIGLTEVGAETIHEAAKYAPIDGGIEVEFSAWFTDILDNGVAKACAELNIPIIAYSPLGAGFLTGQIKSIDNLAPTDYRRHSPRFQPEVFDVNLQLVHAVEGLAKRKGVAIAQVALAWVVAQSAKPGMPTIIPIPGSKSVEKIKENSTLVELTREEVSEIDTMLREFKPKGERFPARLAKYNFA